MMDIISVTAVKNLRGEFYTAIEDPTNATNCRTQKNSRTINYNCGGYALGTYTWFVPYFTMSAVDEDVWYEKCVAEYIQQRKDIPEKCLKCNGWRCRNGCGWSCPFDAASEYAAQEAESYEESDEFQVIKDEVLDAFEECFRAAWRAGEYSSMSLEGGDFPEDSDIFWDTFDTEFLGAFEEQGYGNPTALRLATKMMLAAFHDLRQIDSFDELQDGEYGIVYAAGGGDFHFCRYEDGVYTHKMGANWIEEVDHYDDAFGDRYDSKRIFFAKRKS